MQGERRVRIWGRAAGAVERKEGRGGGGGGVGGADDTGGEGRGGRGPEGRGAEGYAANRTDGEGGNGVRRKWQEVPAVYGAGRGHLGQPAAAAVHIIEWRDLD